jgi:hypothetical protein
MLPERVVLHGFPPLLFLCCVFLIGLAYKKNYTPFVIILLHLAAASLRAGAPRSASSGA